MESLKHILSIITFPTGNFYCGRNSRSFFKLQLLLALKICLVKARSELQCGNPECIQLLRKMRCKTANKSDLPPMEKRNSSDILAATSDESVAVYVGNWELTLRSA
jgi:hypothetical protein